jgi:hypothetical protein
LGPYSDGFRTELAARGYEPSSAAGQLQVMAHLSRWLVDRGLDEHALTSRVVEEFLRARRVAGYRQWLSARGMAPLLDHLRDVGIAPVCSPAVADSAVEVLLVAYRAYLVEERGLAASTVRNYVDVARRVRVAVLRVGTDGPVRLDRGPGERVRAGWVQDAWCRVGCDSRCRDAGAAVLPASGGSHADGVGGSGAVGGVLASELSGAADRSTAGGAAAVVLRPPNRGGAPRLCGAPAAAAASRVAGAVSAPASAGQPPPLATSSSRHSSRWPSAEGCPWPASPGAWQWRTAFPSARPSAFGPWRLASSWPSPSCRPAP